VVIILPRSPRAPRKSAETHHGVGAVRQTNNGFQIERPTEQVSGVLAAIEAKMRSLADDPQIHRQRVRVQAIGKLKLLPASTLAAISAAREATAGYNGMVLTIAVAYGGREEIADAVQALLYEEMRKGATLSDAMGESHRQRSVGTFIWRARPTLISSFGPVERFDYPASCCGRAYITNSISRTSIGQSSGR
jgi:undecaprenyl diphosphate synthase